MVSGGADGALRMWDLEAAELQESEVQHGSVHKPLATAAKYVLLTPCRRR